MRPRAILLRTVTPWIIPGKARSSTYWARPVTLSRPSFRITECPICFSSIRANLAPAYTRSVPDAIAFLSPLAKWFQRRLTHHRFERYPPLGVRAFQFVVDEGIIEARGRRIARGRAEIHALRSRPVNRPQAHRARFAAGVNFAAGEFKRAQYAAGFANRGHLRVRGGVVRRCDAICAGGDDAAFFHHNCGKGSAPAGTHIRSEEHTSELQSQFHLVCRLLLEKK